MNRHRHVFGPRSPRWRSSFLVVALLAGLGMTALGACSSDDAGSPTGGGSSSGGANASSSGSGGSGGSGVGGSSGTSSSGSGGPSSSSGASGSSGTSGATGSSGTAGSSGTSGSSGSPADGGPAGDDSGADAMTGGGTSTVDRPTGEAFNPMTGTLNVDYATYMPKEDIVFNKPNTNPLYGLTVGNGHVGAMVWSQNGLTMQVSGVDTSQQTAFSAGLANLATTPGMDTGYTKFQQRLSLYDGTLTTTYDSDRTVTIFGQPNSEVIGIHVDDTRSGVSGVSFDLSLWDLSTLGNTGAVPNLQTWKTVTTFADASGAGISRGQSDPDNFGYTLAATVEGAAFTSKMVNGSDVRLSITPSASYTIWIASATRLNAPGNNSVSQAQSLLAAAKSTGYAATFPQYRAFWHSFWAKSFVQYSNAAGDADYLENVYYLATYMVAAGGYGNYPFHFINGVFRATQDATKWSNAYWYWNQRDVYNSFLAANHSDVMNVFNNMYSRNFNTLKAYTATRYNITGIWVPETMGWNGNANGTINSPFTDNIYSTGTEAAENMYAQYAYTADAAYLKNTAYPFMREVADFYQQKLTKNPTTGQYYMALSNAHETYWNVQNAITDLAAVRSMFPVVIQTSTDLGVDANLRAQWQDVLDHLAPYPTDGTVYLPHDPPTVKPGNGENVACEIIWPYSVTGIGAPDYAMAVKTWQQRPFPYGNIWANDAIQAARLGLGDDANKGMKTMLQKYQSYPNGLTNNTNGVFEFLGVHLNVVNESLLQSYDGKIRVFPAVPSDSTFVGRFTLAARGGFLVTSERDAGDIKYVGVKSLVGNTATVVNPWSSGSVQVRDLAGGNVVMTSSGPTLTFPTAANGIYVVERVAKPLSSYTYSYLTGTRNDGAKSLSASTGLGI